MCENSDGFKKVKVTRMETEPGELTRGSKHGEHQVRSTMRVLVESFYIQTGKSWDVTGFLFHVSELGPNVPGTDVKRWNSG